MSLLSFAKKKRSVQRSAAPAASPPAAPAVATTIVATGRLGLTPLITEDSVTMHGSSQTIAFRVRPSATKQEIVAAVRERYTIEPTSVRTLHVSGKTRRRGQTVGLSSAWKKAYVTLPAGQTIDVSA